MILGTAAGGMVETTLISEAPFGEDTVTGRLTVGIVGAPPSGITGAAIETTMEGNVLIRLG